MKFSKKRIDEIIETRLNETLYNKGLITEYAVKRNEFKNKFIEQVYRSQLHIALLYYTILFESENPNYTDNLNHWKHEVKIFLDPLCDIKLKNNNNYETRLSALMQAIEEQDLLIDTERIYNKSRKEIRKNEGVVTTDEQWEMIISLVIKHWIPLIKLIANGNTEDLDNYIDNIENY